MRRAVEKFNFFLLNHANFNSTWRLEVFSFFLARNSAQPIVSREGNYSIRKKNVKHITFQSISIRMKFNHLSNICFRFSQRHAVEANLNRRNFLEQNWNVLHILDTHKSRGKREGEKRKSPQRRWQSLNNITFYSFSIIQIIDCYLFETWEEVEAERSFRGDCNKPK